MLAALVAGLAVGLPYELAGGAHAVALSTLAAGAVGTWAAWTTVRHVDRRLTRLVRLAEQVEAGAAVPLLVAERPDLVGQLEDALGRTARAVLGTISVLTVERERMGAILRGMVEGVVVIDLAGTVVLMNGRARDLLGISAEGPWDGRPIVELVRDSGLDEVIRGLTAGVAETPRDVTLEVNHGIMLQVNVARLRAADERSLGLVLVLHDVTELRRLEVVRKYFVANVARAPHAAHRD